MTVYIVFKEGVYRHECFGAFSSIGAAMDSAAIAKSNEPDSYHSFSIVPFVVDAHYELEPEESFRMKGEIG